MYTRDRSTPRSDSYYLGEDDITGAAGSQIDGITTIVFRKKIEGIKKHVSLLFINLFFRKTNVTKILLYNAADGPSDHTIEDELMSVIWAMGQGVDRYVHAPFSGLEACSASDTG